MGKGNDDGKEKYKRKSYTPRGISPLARSRPFLKLLKEKIRLFKELSEDEGARQLPSYPEIERDSRLSSIFYEIGSKGADLEAIFKILPNPVIIDDPENQNPWVLWHINLDDTTRLFLSPQWRQVLEKHRERGNLYTKRQRGLQSAVKKLFKYLEPFDETLYYSDQTKSMHASDLNREIRIKRAEIQALIREYLKFLAVQLSVSSYQGYDKKAYLKRSFRSSKEISKKWNGIIVQLVDELKRIRYSDRYAYKTTGKLLNLKYPHLYEDPDPDLIRQRYIYHKTKNRKNIK